MVINQCDGCMSGADTKQSQWGTLHVDRYGRAFMACVSEIYAQKEAEQKEELANGNDDA